MMGTERKNLDVPAKVTDTTVYGIDIRVPGMKWAAVKSNTARSSSKERLCNLSHFERPAANLTAGKPEHRLWPLNQFQAVAGGIDRDADDDAGVSERPRTQWRSSSKRRFPQTDEEYSKREDLHRTRGEAPRGPLVRISDAPERGLGLVTITEHGRRVIDSSADHVELNVH